MSEVGAAFDGERLGVEMESYLSKHEVVYRSPGSEGREGFPLGNGDAGVMVWTPADRVHFQINKCDTWDDGPDEPFGAWDDGNRANEYTALRHCGELHIESGLPVFDWMYLEDFEGRLSLAEARGSWRAEGPLGKVRCGAFYAGEPKVLVVDYADELGEGTERRVKLGRWGSRVFEHWYAMIKREGHLGPGGLVVGGEGDEVWLEQPTRSVRFAVAAKMVGEGFSVKRFNAHEVGYVTAATKQCGFTLYLSVVTSEEADDPREEARRKVRQAAREGSETIFGRHKKRWLEFWSKSFVNLGDEYLENLWYLNLYQLGASSGGEYPPHFIGSIWGWNRDVRCWNHYYHWNQQCSVWPMVSSGHAELLEPYAKMRRAGLVHALEDARRVHGCEGAFYSDVCNRRGWQDVVAPEDYKPSADDEWLERYEVLVNYNLTPGAQIAHDLYRHYRYTGDVEFARKYAYPIMREWVRFILNYIQLGEDGRYHVPNSDPYESASIRCTDATNTIAYIRVIFPALMELTAVLAGDAELAGRAEEVFGKLAEYVRVELPEEMAAKAGLAAREIIAGGKELDSGKALYKDSELMAGKFTNFLISAQLTPISPAGLVSLDQEGTAEFAAFRNTLEYSLPMAVNGHTATPIWQARMGYGERMAGVLSEWADNHQMFRQGLWGYWPKRMDPILRDGKYYPEGYAADFLNVDAVNRAKVVGQEEYVEIAKGPFAHVGLEAGSIFQAAVNEMLLTSDSRKIRVFPATPAEWAARFSLHAAGGFEVTSEKIGGEVLYVAVKSRLGRDCCVVNPWGSAEVRVLDTTSGTRLSVESGREVKFGTEAGHGYLVEQAARPVSGMKKVILRGEANRDCKKHSDAVLGKPRQF